MASDTAQGPVISVRAFLEDTCGNILLVKRGPTENASGKWSFPGGIVKYTESPELGIERLVKQKTGLEMSDLDFLNYQNSPPSPEGPLHCLNMYFKATAHGDVNISPAFSEYAWVPVDRLAGYAIAFNGNDAIHYYKESKRPVEDQLWDLVAEAESMSIPVSRKQLIELQALPGFFKQMKEDLAVYERVRTKVHATLEMIQGGNKRRHDPIIVQVQSRTKKAKSLMEKMVRKGENGIPRAASTFDDNAGGRATVSFLKDVYTVRDQLLSYPEYQLRQEEDYIKDPQDTGYRGLHLTIEVPLPGASFLPRCEVQIRTVFQHAWSSLTHQLTYKNPEVLDEHIGAFRDLSDTLADADRKTEDLRHTIEHLGGK